MDAIVISPKFIFDDELLINDDRQSLNGYLWAVDHLVDKLPSSQVMENINFYANYNVLTGDVKVEASFYVPDTSFKSGERNEIVEVALTDKEKSELVDVFQSYCRSQYLQTCLEFVNEIRRDEQLPIIVNTLSELPKTFLYKDLNSADKEVFTLGAISECGEPFYLGDDGSFVRSNDTPWDTAERNAEGVPVFNDFAENGLYFEFDLDGNLEPDIVEVLNRPSTIILNDDFAKFVEKHCKGAIPLEAQIQNASGCKVNKVPDARPVENER